MGKRGPKPTPTALLKLRGTFRKHRSKNEPRPEGSVPDCPDWLDEQAKHAWAQLVPQLLAMGVLTEVDANALARYCVFWSRWKAAELFLAKNGSVYPLKDEQGKLRCLVQVPQVAIAHKLGMLVCASPKLLKIPLVSRRNKLVSNRYAPQTTANKPQTTCIKPQMTCWTLKSRNRPRSDVIRQELTLYSFPGFAASPAPPGLGAFMGGTDPHSGQGSGVARRS